MESSMELYLDKLLSCPQILDLGGKHTSLQQRINSYHRKVLIVRPHWVEPLFLSPLRPTN